MKENYAETPKKRLSEFFKAKELFKEFEDISILEITSYVVKNAGEGEENKYDIPRNIIEPFRTEQEKRVRTIIEYYESFLSDVGCKLALVNSPTGFKFAVADVLSVDFSLSLENKEKFISFLESFPRGDEADINALNQLIADNMLKEFYNSSGTDFKEDNNFIEIISGAKEIRDELGKIDEDAFRESRENLDAIDVATKGGYLNEYIEAKNCGILESPDSTWRYALYFNLAIPFITLQDCEQKWHQIFIVLNSLRSNSRTVALYKFARENVLAALAGSIREIEKNLEGDNEELKESGRKWLPFMRKIKDEFEAWY
ncbi:MAG: hypothetical protein ABI430_04770 [Candidatus Taylorbacteria bacterium]